jgi:hypothetical protein
VTYQRGAGSKINTVNAAIMHRLARDRQGRKGKRMHAYNVVMVAVVRRSCGSWEIFILRLQTRSRFTYDGGRTCPDRVNLKLSRFTTAEHSLQV